MEQISLPFRIALGALLLIAALWFSILRPQTPDTTPASQPVAPGAAGLGRAVDKAKGAVATSKSAAARQAAGPAKSAPKVSPTAKAKAPGAATKPSPTLVRADGGKDPSAPLVADLNKGRTLVLLFWNKKGSDDRAVRNAVKGVGHHKGKVVVKAISSKKVGDYEAITRGAQILQSPTVLVIGKDKKAHPIVGFTYTAEIDQLVGDVLAGRAR